jgi:hypothetical protein
MNHMVKNPRKSLPFIGIEIISNGVIYHIGELSQKFASRTLNNKGEFLNYLPWKGEFLLNTECSCYDYN